MRKRRSDSFASGLSAPQRDELFAALSGGKAHSTMAERVKEWSGRKPSETALSAWFHGEIVRRKHIIAAEAMLVTQANCPPDMDERTRLALGQAKYLAVLEDLTPRDVAALAKIDLGERKLELERLKVANDTRVARRDLRLERDRLIFERLKGGERSEDLQSQIDLALAEIEKLKHGEDAP